MVIFLVALYGLIFGSFFNVVIYRLPNKMSLANPSSHCTSCNTRLKPLDLIPVFSWLFLGGKCRYCKSKISVRYTLVELLTSALWVAMYLKFGLTLDFIASVILLSIMLIAAFIDLELHIIPDELVVFGIITGAIIATINGLTGIKLRIYEDIKWWNPLLGAVSASGILLIIAIVGYFIYKTDDAMGLGDVKIYIPIGIYLGWRMALVSLLFSVFIGAIIGITLILFKVRKRKEGMPFGPSIALGVLMTYLVGPELLNLYLATLM